MSEFSFCRSSRLEFFSAWPTYIEFVVSLTLRPKTYRYGTFLRLEFVLAQGDLTERQRDEVICEVLGYALPSPGKPLPASYRAVKSRAYTYRNKWLLFYFSECFYGQAA